MSAVVNGPLSSCISQDNYVFRLRVGYHHEIALLKMVRSPAGMLKMVTTDEAQRLERDLVALPKLTTALHGWVNVFKASRTGKLLI